MEQKQFKAESKRLLDLMIQSIYTHKEIFLRELISNASDAIDKLYFRSLTDDSVNMTKSDFAIEIIPDKENRTLTIKDNGIGISDEEKKKVFDRFYRAEKSRSTKGHFGLGLSIAYDIIKAHNGSIRVTDAEGGGAVFTVILPV